jgi:chromosomal replication initiator protein
VIAYRYKTVPVFPRHEPEVEKPRLTAAEIRPVLEAAFGPRSSIRDIQDEVAQFYGVDADYMRLPDRIGSREPRVSHPRQMAMAMVREFTRFSLPEIGRRFGGRDHTTVIYALRAVAKRALQDPYVALEMEVLRERFAA